MGTVGGTCTYRYQYDAKRVPVFTVPVLDEVNFYMGSRVSRKNIRISYEPTKHSVNKILSVHMQTMRNNTVVTHRHTETYHYTELLVHLSIYFTA